jgi:hypothetical protein
VLEDDPYGLLGFDEEPRRALRADEPEGVIYLGSFSKTFAPGFRVGWILAPHAVRDKLVIASEAQILCPSGYAQAAVATYLGTISTSASFVVAAVVVAFIAALTFVVGFVSRRASVSVAVTMLTCALVIVGLWVLPIVADFVEATVNDKVSSASFNERSGANTVSYEIFLDTFGVGVGLGGSRASSFFPGLLSTTGVVGTLLFAAVIVTLIRRSADVTEYRPVVWALVTLLVLKIVAGPDLSDNSGVVWMSLGLLSHAVLLREARTGDNTSTARVISPPTSVTDRRPHP